jgi:hypothetical protein
LVAARLTNNTAGIKIGMDTDLLLTQHGDETAITVNTRLDGLVISLGQ